MKIVLMVAVSIALCACGQKPAQAPPEAVQKTKDKSSSTITLDQTAQKKAHLVVATVEAKDVAQSLTVPGQLSVNEDKTWHVGAVAGGKIDQLTARIGDSTGPWPHSQP